ncbi:hypothetical protein [Streptomyces sp. NPDC059003]|uniref:hypothetical protein n=1 Tax=Streptomyces sp. NPDC059003 TaxID=3346691 RepID=UPI00369B84A3
MTISDAVPLPWASSLESSATRGSSAEPRVLGTVNSLEFRVGPERSPAQVVHSSRRFATMVLPALLGELPQAETLAQQVLAVLTELVDVTARHRGSVDLGGRISRDEGHVLVTVGEMGRPLPDPGEEPGLFLVQRLVDDIGQYRGEEGGYTTWASVPARSHFGGLM